MENSFCEVRSERQTGTMTEEDWMFIFLLGKPVTQTGICNFSKMVVGRDHLRQVFLVGCLRAHNGTERNSNHPGWGKFPYSYTYSGTQSALDVTWARLRL